MTPSTKMVHWTCQLKFAWYVLYKEIINMWNEMWCLVGINQLLNARLFIKTLWSIDRLYQILCKHNGQYVHVISQWYVGQYMQCKPMSGYGTDRIGWHMHSACNNSQDFDDSRSYSITLRTKRETAEQFKTLSVL